MNEQAPPTRRRTRELSAEEYRARAYRRSPRWKRSLFLAVAVVVGLTVAIIGYRNFGSTPITPQVTAFTVRGDSIRMTAQIQRSHPDRPVSCVLRARDRAGAVLTRTTVRLPAGAGTVTVTRTLHTRARPTVGEVESCRYVG